MTDEWHVADMLRGDVAEARKAWLDEVKHDPEARAKREESDFLTVDNYEGEKLDFHSVRHTFGSWLALQCIHPNLIKTVMRHSTITLTMDTYGHLLPDQHAQAIGGMINMLYNSGPTVATGTTGKSAITTTAVQTAVGARKTPHSRASRNDAMRNEEEEADEPEECKSLRIADVCETVPDDATSRGRTRTGTGVSPQGILSPGDDSVSPDPVASSDDTILSPTSRADSRNDIGPDLARLFAAWPTLPEPLKVGILAMVEAAAK